MEAPETCRAGHRGRSTRESVAEQGRVRLCEPTCPGQRACPCAGGRWAVTGALLDPGNKVIKAKSLPSRSSLSGQSRLEQNEWRAPQPPVVLS